MALFLLCVPFKFIGNDSAHFTCRTNSELRLEFFGNAFGLRAFGIIITSECWKALWHNKIKIRSHRFRLSSSHAICFNLLLISAEVDFAKKIFLLQLNFKKIHNLKFRRVTFHCKTLFKLKFLCFKYVLIIYNIYFNKICRVLSGSFLFSILCKFSGQPFRLHSELFVRS